MKKKKVVKLQTWAAIIREQVFDDTLTFVLFFLLITRVAAVLWPFRCGTLVLVPLLRSSAMPRAGPGAGSRSWFVTVSLAAGRDKAESSRRRQAELLRRKVAKKSGMIFS